VTGSVVNDRGVHVVLIMTETLCIWIPPGAHQSLLQSAMHALVRPLLALGILLIGLLLVVSHGTRGFLVLIGAGLAATLPGTSGWQRCERWLIRLTGSRRRAAALIMLMLIGAVTAINVYQLLR